MSIGMARLCGPSIGIASRRPVVSRSTSRSILAACPNHSLVKEHSDRGRIASAFGNGETRHPTETSPPVNPRHRQIRWVQARNRSWGSNRMGFRTAQNTQWLIRKSFFATLGPSETVRGDSIPGSRACRELEKESGFAGNRHGFTACPRRHDHRGGSGRTGRTHSPPRATTPACTDSAPIRRRRVETAARVSPVVQTSSTRMIVGDP